MGSRTGSFLYLSRSLDPKKNEHTLIVLLFTEGCHGHHSCCTATCPTRSSTFPFSSSCPSFPKDERAVILQMGSSLAFLDFFFLSFFSFFSFLAFLAFLSFFSFLCFLCSSSLSLLSSSPLTLPSDDPSSSSSLSLSSSSSAAFLFGLRLRLRTGERDLLRLLSRRDADERTGERERSRSRSWWRSWRRSCSRPLDQSHTFRRAGEQGDVTLMNQPWGALVKWPSLVSSLPLGRLLGPPPSLTTLPPLSRPAPPDFDCIYLFVFIFLHFGGCVGNRAFRDRAKAEKDAAQGRLPGRGQRGRPDAASLGVAWKRYVPLALSFCSPTLIVL